MSQSRLKWKTARAIVTLPLMVVGVIPFLIALYTSTGDLIDVAIDPSWLRWIMAGPTFALGLWLLGYTITLFYRVGRGTLASWDPTTRLVVAGPYRRTRNPMISGVLFILVGEAIVTGSEYVLIWAGFFFILNNVYFLLREEPGLLRRSGRDYELYKRNVPRWIPRIAPWEPPGDD